MWLPTYLRIPIALPLVVVEVPSHIFKSLHVILSDPSMPPTIRQYTYPPIKKTIFPSLYLTPFLLPLSTVPCRVVFEKPEDLETWPYHVSFLLRMGQLHAWSCCVPLHLWCAMHTMCWGVGSISSPLFIVCVEDRRWVFSFRMHRYHERTHQTDLWS